MWIYCCVFVIFYHSQTIYPFQRSKSNTNVSYHERYGTKSLVNDAINDLEDCLPIFDKCLSWSDVHEDRLKICEDFYDIHIFKNVTQPRRMYNFVNKYVEVHRCWKIINVFTPHMDDFFYIH
uniref:Saposin B-type domain-containing protein n=1 Tax=Strongyloides papillosus TaxID=174720 RepID=A0A0N5C6D8_STREA